MTLSSKVCSCELRTILNVEPLLRTERSQLRYFGHVAIIPQERWARQVLLAATTGNRPRGRPSTRWRDHITSPDLAWTFRGVEPAEVSEFAENREVVRVLGCYLRDPPKRIRGYEIEFFTHR